MIETDMLKSIGDEKMAAFINQIGMNRLGRQEDVANVALFLVPAI
jgi:NAD(P)-dependent dehydrogenase (short-subunit alcohol dehydrogenase family)